MKEITDQIEQSIEAQKKVKKELVQKISESADMIENAFKNGRKLLTAGNGGSSSEASHMAAEFTGRYKLERTSLPAIALSSETSAVTAISNDYGYEQVFSRQLEGLGQEGDVFIAMSTSGNSENLIRAIEKAKEKKISVISLLGKDGGKMKDISDLDLTVSHDDTPRIQEAHLTIIHIICGIVEKKMFE